MKNKNVHHELDLDFIKKYGFIPQDDDGDWKDGDPIDISKGIEYLNAYPEYMAKMVEEFNKTIVPKRKNKRGK